LQITNPSWHVVFVGGCHDYGRAAKAEDGVGGHQSRARRTEAIARVRPGGSETGAAAKTIAEAIHRSAGGKANAVVALAETILREILGGKTDASRALARTILRDVAGYTGLAAALAIAVLGGASVKT
jgi:hypothetical protein